MPGPYDYGPERVAWLGHLATNWMGDAGFLRRLNVMVLRHNLIGDTTWCRGRVTAQVARAASCTLARATATNQRGEMIASGVAEVVLPAHADDAPILDVRRYPRSAERLPRGTPCGSCSTGTARV